MKGLVAAVALLGASPALAQDESVGVRLREWLARLDGTVKAQGQSIPSTTIDIDDELGLDEAEVANEIQLSLRLPVIGRFTGGYWWVDFKGDEVLERTIVFNDNAYLVGTRVKTELELDVFYLNYEFVLPLPLGFGEQFGIDVGLIVGVRGILAEGAIDNEFFSDRETAEGGLPVVGGHVAIQVTPFLRGDAEVLGLAYSTRDRRAAYLEGYGEVVVQPWKGLFAGIGYKYVRVDLEDHSSDPEFDVDITIAGFYVTAGVRF